MQPFTSTPHSGRVCWSLSTKLFWFMYDGIRFDEGFRADLIVENCVVVELKSVEELSRVHSKQLLTYLRLLDYRLGLLINFGAPVIKAGIRRIVNRL
jgi:GxxExxY protein